MSEQTETDAGERTGNYDTVEDFNRECPIGTPVLAFPGSRDGRALYTKTRSTAWMIGPEPVVMVEGYAGGIALTHIEVVPPTQPPAAPETDVNALAKVIASVTDLWDEPLDEVHDIPPIANALAAHLADLSAARERVRVVEGERDALAAAYATAPSCEAQGTCRALPAEQQWIKAMGERDVLAKAMWDARALFGFDTDGDKRYSTDYLAIARSFLCDMAEIRTEINDRIEEVVIEEDRAESAEAAHAEGMAKAWDKGHRAGVMWDHTQHTDGTYSPDANPYRHDGAR